MRAKEKKTSGSAGRLQQAAAAAIVGVLGLAPAAHAQSFDLVGTRAKGMAGAFVAVADDATATWWNPAGISNTLILDGVADFRHEQLIDPAQTPISKESAGLRTTVGDVTVAVPAVAFGYFRVRETGVEAATGEGGRGRQDRGTAPVARSLLTQQFGVTLTQSLTDVLVVGATVRVVHGTLGTAAVSLADPGLGLDAAASADGPSGTKGDVDLGALVRAGRLRVGFAARNLTSPAFTAVDGMVWRVSRQARVGVALVKESPRGGRQDWTVSADADLVSDDTPFGRHRDIAAGAERWVTTRIALRGGVAASTVDAARPTGSFGASVGVKSGVFVEGQVTAGSDRAAQGWGISAHLRF